MWSGVGCFFVMDEVLLASERIRPFIRWTPLEYSPWLSALGDAQIYVKLGKS